jgi:hypothetical protein
MSNSEKQKERVPDHNQEVDNHEEDIELMQPEPISNANNLVESIDNEFNPENSIKNAEPSTGPFSEQNKNEANKNGDENTMKIIMKNGNSSVNIMSIECEKETKFLDKKKNLDEIEDNLFSTKKNNSINNAAYNTYNIEDEIYEGINKDLKKKLEKPPNLIESQNEAIDDFDNIGSMECTEFYKENEEKNNLNRKKEVITKEKEILNS